MRRELVSRQVCVVARVDPVFRNGARHEPTIEPFLGRIKHVVLLGQKVLFETVSIEPRGTGGL